MFEALALALCKDLPVAHAAQHMRVSAKRLWRRIAHYVSQARIKDDMSEVKLIGIDETSVKKGHQYITVVHDLQAKRLLFATSGKDNTTVESFTQDLAAHGGQPQAIEHVCMDMSAAFAKGVREKSARRRSVTTAFTSWLWPARLWTRCARRKCVSAPTKCARLWAVRTGKHASPCSGLSDATPAPRSEAVASDAPVAEIELADCQSVAFEDGFA